jgi:hypothetical protein
MFNLNFKIMKTRTSKSVLGIFVLASLFVVACDKKDDLPENETVEMEELAIADAEFDNVFQESLEEVDEFSFVSDDAFSFSGKKSDSTSLGSSGRREISKTLNEDGSVVIVIDYFDFINARSRFDREKNGRIIIEITGRPASPEGFLRKIVFENFMVGKYKIEGTKTIERNPSNPLQFTVTLENGKVSFEDGTLLLVRNYERIITWVNGSDTPYFIWDDVYTVEGQGYGLTRDGREFSSLIIEPLVIKRTCKYIVSGILELKLGDREVTINYSEGEECNGQFRVNSRLRNRIIKLRTGQ